MYWHILKTMNTRYLIGLLGAIVLFFSACKEKQYLVGYYTYEDYQKECKWENFVDKEYKPKEKWMDSLKTIQMEENLRVQLFLGSYCPDSKKWVPRFYGLKDELPIGNVEIISVDTTKKDEKGFWKAAKLEKIPTFIFYSGEEEVGRIVEKPKGRLEKHLFRLLKSG